MTVAAATIEPPLEFIYTPVKVSHQAGGFTHTLRVFDVTEGIDLAHITDVASRIFDQDLSVYEPDRKWDRRLVLDLTIPEIGSQNRIKVDCSTEKLLIAIRETSREGQVFDYPVKVLDKSEIEGKELISYNLSWDTYTELNQGTVLLMDEIVEIFENASEDELD